MTLDLNSRWSKLTTWEFYPRPLFRLSINEHRSVYLNTVHFRKYHFSTKLTVTNQFGPVRNIFSMITIWFLERFDLEGVKIWTSRLLKFGRPEDLQTWRTWTSKFLRVESSAQKILKPLKVPETIFSRI